jgi:hypothetical protein
LWIKIREQVAIFQLEVRTFAMLNNARMKKIQLIQGAGTFDSQYGTLYKFEYQFEDNTWLVANHKEAKSPFKPGDMVEIEVTREFNGVPHGKVKKPEQARPQSGGREQVIERQWAINAAIQFLKNNDPDYCPMPHTLDNVKNLAIELSKIRDQWETYQAPTQSPPF